jgi:dTDP-3-amino-2,3,6-trideoxy-4-keto-D-glucose/dTDP-3-amino-3,4,6-trideoxy-alpha-D-glucose/dTDP-2,6-dideoxy-D-kanosamine transaminase
MKVRYSYLVEQFANSEEILKDLKDQLKRCEFTFGAELHEFELKFAALCQVKYAIGVGTGTDALFLSMKASGIGPGDEVITAPNTFIATVGAIVATGARPVFVDVNKEFNIDPNLIENAITGKTKYILPVHYAGCPADMPKIMEIAQRHNLAVIEDACQAISASIDRRLTGTFGMTGGFSLHPLKNLNVWGDGGIIVTNSEKMFNKLILLRNHGLRNRDEVEIFGYNSRLDTIQAIVGNHLIKHIDFITNTRIKNATIYDHAFSDLADYIRIPPRRPNMKHVYHLYMIEAEDRDKLLTYLIENDIEAKIHYPIPIHLQKAAQHFGYKEGDFPVCEAQSRSILTLPVHQHLPDDQISYVIDHVRKFYKTK